MLYFFVENKKIKKLYIHRYRPFRTVRCLGVLRVGVCLFYIKNMRKHSPVANIIKQMKIFYKY